MLNQTTDNIWNRTDVLYVNESDWPKIAHGNQQMTKPVAPCKPSSFDPQTVSAACDIAVQVRAVSRPFY